MAVESATLLGSTYDDWFKRIDKCICNPNDVYWQQVSQPEGSTCGGPRIYMNHDKQIHN